MGQHAAEGRPEQPSRTIAGRVVAALLTVKGVVVAGGAVAVAITAILALIPRTEPLSVRFTSATASRSLVPVSQFTPPRHITTARGSTGAPGSSEAQRTARLTFRLRTTGDLDATSSSRVETIETTPATPTGGADATTPSGSTSSTGTGTGPGTGTATTTSPGTPSSSGTPSGSGGLGSPTTTPASPASPSSDTSPSPSSPTVTQSGAPRNPRLDLPRAYVSDVLERVRATFVVPPELVALPAMGAATDPDGHLVSPRVAAARIVRILSHVRSRPAPPRPGDGDPTVKTEQGQQPRARREPLGVVIRAKVELTHAKGEVVLVDWEIADADSGKVQSLSGEWLNNVAAYQVVASQDPDVAPIVIWVPMPARRGSYLVSLSAWAGPDNLPKDVRDVAPIVH